MEHVLIELPNQLAIICRKQSM